MFGIHGINNNVDPDGSGRDLCLWNDGNFSHGKHAWRQGLTVSDRTPHTDFPFRRQRARLKPGRVTGPKATTLRGFRALSQGRSSHSEPFFPKKAAPAPAPPPAEAAPVERAASAPALAPADDFNLPIPEYPDVPPLRMYNPRKVRHRPMFNVPQSDSQRNYIDYAPIERKMAIGVQCEPPVFAGKWMPKGYKELPTTEQYQQFSAPPKLRSVLCHEKQVPVQISMAFQYDVDTFRRAPAGAISPALFADLRASERGRKLREAIANGTR